MYCKIYDYLWWLYLRLEKIEVLFELFLECLWLRWLKMGFMRPAGAESTSSMQAACLGETTKTKSKVEHGRARQCVLRMLLWRLVAMSLSQAHSNDWLMGSLLVGVGRSCSDSSAPPSLKQGAQSSSAFSGPEEFVCSYFDAMRLVQELHLRQTASWCSICWTW